MKSTKLSLFCSKVLEIGWLLAVIITPLFFNIYSSRVFEPDKLTTLRSVAVIMAGIWLVKVIEERLSGERGLEITWRTPLVLPTLAMVGAYFISTVLSISPWTSVFGSYQRLQGTFTYYSYIIIFLMIIQELRTRAQLDRLITVIILNSLPIALYGFLQHNGLDPLPWGGDVTRRIASNMGNAIFVAAYLIMTAVLTLTRVLDSFRAILNDEEASAADVTRASAYIFMFLVQLVAIWYTRSRGPQMGLLVGLGTWAFLGIVSLQRASQREEPFERGSLWHDLGRGTGFAFATLAAAGAVAGAFYFGGRAIVGPESRMLQWAAVGSGGLTFAGTWLGFIASRRGWRWLWISTLVLAVLFAAGFLTINVVEPVQAWAGEQPWLGRLDDVLQPESGTGKVRSLLWEQSLSLFLPHEPIEKPPTEEHPRWRPDRLNALRPLVGYGPESMFVAANRFYPPLLGHYEKRTASGDRAHNETMDWLVVTGVTGFATYIWLFGAIFYFSLLWLGLLDRAWQRRWFLILIVAGAIVTSAVVMPMLGAQFMGLAIPVGMVGGMLLYIVVHAFSLYGRSDPVAPPHPDAILVIGLLSAIVAHLIEINFGISIAATRTTFWAYAGMLVVVGAGFLQSREVAIESVTTNQNAGRRRRRKKRSRRDTYDLPAWVTPVVTIGVIGGFMLGTLMIDFLGSNLSQIESGFRIIWRALTMLQDGSRSGGVLMIFLMTWLMGGAVIISQMFKVGLFRGHEDDWLWAGLTYLAVSGLIWIGFSLVLADYQLSLSRVRIESLEQFVAHLDRVASILGRYYGLIIFSLIAGGVVLYTGTRERPRLLLHPQSVIVIVVLLPLCGFTIVRTNMDPIQADIVYKQGNPYERQDWRLAIEAYRHALNLAPHEDFYHLYLGRAYVESAGAVADAGAQAELMTIAEQTLRQARVLNPLNTDHSANLARMFNRWASLAANPEERQAYLQLSERNYDIATSLSPNHATLWNEWALLYFSMGDFERAQAVVDRSLSIDDEFVQTWMIQADLYYNQGQNERALEAYQEALAIDPDQTQVWLQVGDIYRTQNLTTEAVSAYQQAVEENPRLLDGWLRLGDTYVNIGELENAADAYGRALELNPEHAATWRVLGGYVYVQLGRLEAAANALERAIELEPEAADVWDTYRVLAIVYDNLGREELALENAQAALERAPEDQKPDLRVLVSQLQQSAGGS